MSCIVSAWPDFNVARSRGTTIHALPAEPAARRARSVRIDEQRGLFVDADAEDVFVFLALQARDERDQTPEPRARARNAYR